MNMIEETLLYRKQQQIEFNFARDNIFNGLYMSLVNIVCNACFCLPNSISL